LGISWNVLPGCHWGQTNLLVQAKRINPPLLM
jgi:hypothetical protein